ncbi:hypothetical protein D5086_000044 [Populus alba]|uniref:Uncharacterized protein n=1 Tax=Populus alba TaxID=43335 RepID=A0ACC4CW29_POPAL
MEAMKMKIFVVLMVVLMAFSTMQKAAAADAPAPSPASDATIFVPTFLASLVALAFGTKLKAFVGRMVMSCSLADSIGVYVVIVEGDDCRQELMGPSIMIVLGTMARPLNLKARHWPTM